LSTDTTFFTNEKNNSLLNRFKTTIQHAQFFDILVGYFRTSGFHRLYKELESVDKIRILVGLSVDKATYEGIQTSRQQEIDLDSHKATKEAAATNTIQELEESEDNYDVELGITKFIEYLKKDSPDKENDLANGGNGKKLEFRVYPTRNIHAKVYITRYKGDIATIQKGSVITGSSNFSESGLHANREFNVELKQESDLDFAIEQFEDLWRYSVDISKDYVDTIEKKTWLSDDVTPYELYLKMLYEYFKEDINLDKQIEFDLPEGYLELDYQKQAVTAAKKILDAYNGVFLADVVGLGKTFISALLAQQLPGGKLIICPPVLKEYWEETLFDFGVKKAEVESLGKLDRIISVLKNNPNKYSTIFIDEAHRFRNEYTKGFEKLYEITYGKKIVLVSATPLNNKFQDILNQIKLFQAPRKSWIPGVTNLEEYFKQIQRKLDKLQKSSEEYSESIKQASELVRTDILSHIMVRRTRTEIKNFFYDDIENRGLFFPEVADPHRIIYKLDSNLNITFTHTLELLKLFSYSRYTPLRFIKKSKLKQYGIDEFDIQQQKNLGGFMKGILVKRLESSFHAFKMTVGRFIDSYRLFIEMYNKGTVLISKTVNVYDIYERDDIEEIIDDLGEEKIRKFKSSDFEDNFIQLLQSDLEKLEEIQADWNKIIEDPKLAEFIDKLHNDEQLTQRKAIVFTESKETGDHLFKQLNNEFPGKVFFYSGGGGVSNEGTFSNSESRRIIKENFDPNYKNQKELFDLIITTDILAEGVNLHRSNIVINYDLPWNPTRVLQRVGRVNRVGTSHHKIYIYNFFPTDESEKEINLEANIVNKIQAFHDTLGEDSKYLTEGEEVSTHQLFGDKLVKKLNDKKTYESEEENQSELEYLKVIRNIRDNNPILFNRIKRLPKKSRSAIKRDCPNNGLITFFRKGQLKKFIHNTGLSVNEVTFFNAISIFENESTHRDALIEKDYYDMLSDNKMFFISILTKEEIAPTGQRGRSNEAYVIGRLKVREFRTFSEFTDEDEDFITLVLRKMLAGEIPQNIIRRIKRKIEKELGSQKVLMILKQEIPDSILTEIRRRYSPESTKSEIILSEYMSKR
jgi:superfamily II DNA or RNA helicase/HKD family nuclease